jgi:hypothetical protein
MIPYQSVSLVFLLKVAESKQRFDRRILVLIDPSVTETGGTRDFPVPGRDGTKKKESRAGWDGTGQRLKLCGTGRDSMTVPSVPPIDILCYIEIADKS